MPSEITGPFEVKLTTRESQTVGEGPPLVNMSIDKTFSGAITGTSVGQMVAYQTGVEGSAGYVALEVVAGTVEGKSGTFALQHSSTMANSVGHQDIQVVPDSGTGELTGLRGTMTIEIADDGAHNYVFEYDIME